MTPTSSPIRSHAELASRTCSRRECLQAMGTVLVGATACAVNGLAAPTDLRAKAKANIRLGIDASVYSKLPLEEAVRRIRDDGFRSALTTFTFADVRFDPWSPDWEVVQKITACFERHDVRVAALFGYYNVVDPDPARRQRGEARMELLIANWKRLGCPVISTETGTFNRTSEWLDAPENATEEGYAQCRAAFEKLAHAAEKTGATISIEAYWKNVIGSIDRAARLFRDVPSPALKLVMDPCNFFRKEELPQMQPMLVDMFQRLGDRIVIAHAKDVKAAAGQGVLDYPLYLRLLAQLDRPIDLIVEHLTLPDVARARDYVLGQLDKV
ncbi:MAG: sugar phosphate isomerase/epimerase [Planctomycetota bacterium]|nr:sugar phosphate isomerase/epimerase [Planctomycetota bacterium]